MPKTKIICTLGPASSSVTAIRNMVMAGMDVARFNFSHSGINQHQKLLGIVRQINKKYRRHIRILQDLEGYRIRIGRFKNARPVELKKRCTVWLTQEEAPGSNRLVPFSYGGDLGKIGLGQLIYIDDGNILLKVKGREKRRLKTRVVVGGVLKERKGVNIPGLRLPFTGITDKDRKDLAFSINNKADFIAQSFVRSRKDIVELKRLVGKQLPGCKVIAKIENRDGIKNIDEILDTADGVMIARGDMGVSVPVYEVPFIQKEIIKKCNKKKKPVITATQMLESMTEHRRPTRAEASDVANAILDGSDFLMLSAETAAGEYPVEVVKTMNDIIVFTEKSKYYKKR